MRWAEISVVCAPEAQDAVSYAMLEAGCGGVALTGSAAITVCGSLPVSDDLTPRIAALQAHLGALASFGLPALREGITLRYADDEDWANAWRQYFKPMKLGRRLVIKPSWETYEPIGDDLILELDPGMAFGTGGHPTTRLCLSALEDCVRPGMRIADIGTGSGILSIAAARLGASVVYATDIDPLPLRVARENVAHNGLADTIRVLELAEFDRTAAGCDVVVANIVANTIVEIAPSIPGRLAADGVFIASGIVEEHEETVRAALEAVGLQWIDTLREDIWVCLTSRFTRACATDPAALRRAAQELPPLVGRADAGGDAAADSAAAPGRGA